MKPIYLSFKAFGPYVDKQEIDFESLDKSGLFLICGETGSGKTTILDAICFALYGKSSGGTRGDLTSMRCQIADDKTDTEIEYIFETENRRYKFVRTVKFGRKNFNTSQNVFVQNANGVFEPIYANPKLSDLENEAKRLIGLTYDQFRQVIVLPQGQFEKLLTSNSEDKEKILVTLFNAEKWQRAADKVYEKAKAYKDKLSNEFSEIQYKLREHQCETEDELSQLYKTKKADLELLQEKRRGLDNRLKNFAKEYDTCKEIYEKYALLTESEQNLVKMSAKEYIYAQKNEQILKSDFASDIKPLYDKKEESVLHYQARQQQYKKAYDEQKVKNEQLKNAVLDKEKYEKNLLKADKMREELTVMNSLTDFYDQWEKEKANKEIVKTRFTIAEKNLNHWQHQYDEKKLISEDADINLSKAYTKCSQIYNLYAKSISAVLAQTLKDGNPCPVCGSLTHPYPASPTGETVTEDMKRAAEAEKDKCEKERDLAQKVLIETSEQLEKFKLEFEAAKHEYDIICQREKMFEEKKLDAIDSPDQLKAQIEKYENALKRYDEGKKNAEHNLELAANNLAKSESAAKIAAEEMAKAQKTATDLDREFQYALQHKGFENEADMKKSLLTAQDKQNIISECEKFKNDLATLKDKIYSLKQELSNKEKPDILKLTADKSELEKLALSASKNEAVASAHLKSLENVCTSVSKRMNQFKTDIIKAEEDMRFAIQIRGDHGIGLQRYVLAVMLSAVTAEANKLLAEVHGGRYKLLRTSSTAQGRTRKSGLELEVFDSFSGERRSVVSLSGGEKFLAALSLSIGLSSVVMAQSGGKKLGAMFVDEGFGSLDPTSVSDALAVLSHVKNAKGTVGIISHVSTLKETIPTRVEISKGKNGSQCKTVVD